MTNRLVNALNSYANTKTTENGATALSSTNSALYDMFALGGAYRTRSEADCILLPDRTDPVKCCGNRAKRRFRYRKHGT